MARSMRSHATLEGSSRRMKSRKIVSVLRRFVNLNQCDVLDIGTGSGHIIHEISKRCASASSVDFHDERMITAGYAFKRVADERLPFADNSFDVVISNHVIEHLRDQQLHISEIHRVLKNGGVCYLATPNRHWLVDPHYRLPLVSWLPRRLSLLCVKLLKRREWDISPLSFGSLKRLAKGRFTLVNMTLDIIKQPHAFGLDEMTALQPFLRIMPVWCLRMLNPFVPTYVLVLVKPLRATTK